MALPGAYTPASIDLWVIGSCKPPLHNKAMILQEDSKYSSVWKLHTSHIHYVHWPDRNWNHSALPGSGHTSPQQHYHDSDTGLCGCHTLWCRRCCSHRLQKMRWWKLHILLWVKSPPMWGWAWQHSRTKMSVCHPKILYAIVLKDLYLLVSLQKISNYSVKYLYWTINKHLTGKQSRKSLKIYW